MTNNQMAPESIIRTAIDAVRADYRFASNHDHIAINRERLALRILWGAYHHLTSRPRLA